MPLPTGGRWTGKAGAIGFIGQGLGGLVDAIGPRPAIVDQYVRQIPVSDKVRQANADMALAVRPYGTGRHRGIGTGLSLGRHNFFEIVDDECPASRIRRGLGLDRSPCLPLSCPITVWQFGPFACTGRKDVAGRLIIGGRGLGPNRHNRKHCAQHLRE